MSATPVTATLEPRPRTAAEQSLRRNGWNLALFALMGGLLVIARLLRPEYGASDLQSLATEVLPIAFAAAAQAVCVIAGGVDLSVGSMMAFTTVTAAVLMKDRSDEFALVAVILVLLLGLSIGSINGLLIVVSRVPDIVVTLAMSFVWAGCALLVLNTPGGGAADWFKSLSVGSWGTEWVPRALMLLAIAVGVVWIPLRRSRLGLSIYAIGSDHVAALRSGVDVRRTKVAAYAVTGLFCAMGGLALTMNTGIGTPVPGPYTLASVAAIVLGGVSLVGGRGGMLGPLIAAFVLALVRYDLFFLGVDANYSTVIQGIVLVVVVMIGGLVAIRRSRRRA
ncbi:MAG: ABC transporter permease [Candidatus Limnocylindrales bacterium]